MGFVADNAGLILEGFWTTVRLAALSGVLALAVGTVLAVLRVCPVPTLRWAGAGYVTVLRNTPLTLVFVFSTFGLPRLDIRLSFFAFAVIALTAYTSAFVCEAVRSGINAVAPGEIEAARSIGLPFGQTLALVVLPQAFRAVIPPLSGLFIALTKNTSIAVAFSVAEATSILRRLQNADASATFPLLLSTAAGYLVLSLGISFAFSRLERRVADTR
ncbi:amino acid ABC transporter permease [soil metagenome]|nr:amino acid ABC transporter permease [Acidimicrobiia bacterium]